MQEAPKISQKIPKSAREAAKKRSRTPKIPPRDAQEGLGDSHPPPKSSPARSRTPLQTRLGVFGEHVADLSSQKAFSEASANEFRLIFSMIAQSVNLDFYRPCRGFRRFFKNVRCSIDVGGMREKTSKNSRWKPPKSSPEPSEIL